MNGAVAAQSTQPIGMLALVGEATDATLDPIPFSEGDLPRPPPPPAVNEGGVTLANLTPPVSSIAPRSIASVFGARCAEPGTRIEVSPGDLVGGRLPTTLGGVCVEMAGVRAPMLFVAPDQVNVQAPDLAVKGPVPVEVITGCGTASQMRSAAETANLDSAAPAFFVLRFDGAGGVNPVAALHGGGPAVVGDPSVVRQADCTLCRAARPRLTFSRMSEAVAVQMKGVGCSLCWAM